MRKTQGGRKKYNNMRKEIIELSSIGSIIIFLVCMIKLVLINWFELLPIYGSTNRFISWFILLPLILIGVVLSIRVIKNYLPVSEKAFKSYNVILIIPLLLYSSYLFILFIISFFR